MAQHFEIDPDQNGVALKIASRALDVANGQSTARPGSVYIPNGDGTGTLIGSQAGTDSTGSSVGVAPWVGDTTPPGKPTGITCKTSWGSLYVEWDGTLEGGIPSDFSHISVLVNDVEIGQMTGSGTLVQSGYSNGETLQVTAVAYDSAHDRVGNLTPNASESFGPVEVIISDEKAEIDADVAEIQKKADQASKDAAAASSKADALQGEVSDVKTTINGVETELNGLSTKVEGAVSNANEALTTATEAKQTATEVKTTADRAYENAEEAIKQSSTAVQTATEVKTTLETDYQTKSDADASYASKSELSQTSESIKSEVSKTYATKSSVDELQNIADNAIESWTGTVEPTASNKPASDWTTPELKKQHSGDLYYNTTTGYSYRWGSTDGTNYSWSLVKDTDITKALADAAAAQSTANSATSKADAAQSSADAAQSAADAAQSGVDKLNVDIPATYATKSSVEQTAESIRSEVSKTYQPKGDYATNAQLGSYAEKSYVDQKAGEITSAVESTYVSKTDASKTYATKTEVKQEADSIRSTVSEVQTTADSALEKASTVEQTASGITIRLDQTVKDVSAAQSAADAAADAATSAQSTANAANTAAGKAQTTANSASTAASNAQSAATKAQSTADSAASTASTAASDASTAKSNAASAVTTANGAKTTADAASKTATTAASDASTAKKNASDAVSTANTAKSTADTAKSTADSASTAAANAQSTANAASTAANNAAKVATNYLSFDSSGLTVGNVTGTLQGNTHLTSDSVEVRNGSTVLSRFKAALIELGLNAKTAVIKMCGGLLSIAGSTSSGSGIITITANKLSSDASSPQMRLKTLGAYQTQLMLSSEDASYGSNTGIKGSAILTASHVTLNNGSRTTQLSESYGNLSLISATNRESGFPARWVKRGGWLCLQGRVKVPSHDAQIANIKSLVDSLALPPSGVNRNFTCIGNNNSGALTFYNIYMGSDGILRAGGFTSDYGSNTFIDLSGVIIMAGVD